MSECSLDTFIVALRWVETGSNPDLGTYAIGDLGRSIGPFQIQEAYHRDSGVSFSYELCNWYWPSVITIWAYMARYCPTAVKQRDFQKMARIHNGGPRGHLKKSTEKYWNRVLNYMTQITIKDIKDELVLNNP